MLYAQQTQNGIRLVGYMARPSLVIATIKAEDGQKRRLTFSCNSGSVICHTHIKGQLAALNHVPLPKRRINWEALDEKDAEKLEYEPAMRVDPNENDKRSGPKRKKLPHHRTK